MRAIATFACTAFRGLRLAFALIFCRPPAPGDTAKGEGEQIRLAVEKVAKWPDRQARSPGAVPESGKNAVNIVITFT